MSGIKRDTAIPLYLQISDDIRNKITKKEFKENFRIPTEAELSQSYQVSRITIRKALEILEDEEILVRKRGLGTFVSAKKVSRNLNCFMGFTKSCELNGKKVETQVLSVEIVRAMPSDIKQFHLQSTDKVLSIRRLRYCDGEPVILEENHFLKKYQYLLSEDLKGSLNGILQRRGVEFSRGSKTLGVYYATREEAKLLRIKENTALIISRDIAYDDKNHPVYSSKEIINAERYEYKIITNKW